MKRAKRHYYELYIMIYNDISGFINERTIKGTWVQHLATKKEKADMLEILLDLGYLSFLQTSLLASYHQV